ncbi:MAG: metallopeptidase TldD-related protein [Bacteroidia bacterium]
MNNYFKAILFSFIFIAACRVADAQKKENVIMNAMNDELNRSMNDLKYGEYAKPFFIAYSITDSKSITIMATLGALIRSLEFPQKTQGVRLLAGGYDFNDESLDNDIVSGPGMNEIAMPVNDDYYGIRRALWASTDNVYKNASKHFQRNKMNLEEQKKELKDIPHRSFAKTDVVKLLIDSPFVKYDKVKLENYVRELSALFTQYGDLTGSNVYLSFNEGNNYFANSEGTRVITPFRLAVLGFGVDIKSADGDNLSDQLNYYASEPGQFPSTDKIKKDISEMVKKLEAKRTAAVFNEDYSGPVLIEHGALAEIIAGTLFSNDEGVIANNEINTGNGMAYDQGSSPDSRMGKTIVSEMITVKALPKMKTFKGMPLLGAFDADNEGVIPPAQLTLVEKGKLKNLLNDRTITKPGQTANGHGQGPGVISVSFENTVAKAELKNRLIKEAKSENLEYAFILKSIKEKAGGRGQDGGADLDIYKVSLTDGTEEFVRSAKLNSISTKVFKKIIAASNDTVVEHIEARASQTGVVSLLIPGAVVFKQLELSGSETPFYKNDIFVVSPLKGNMMK